MSRRFRGAWLVATTLALVGAAGVRDPLELVRAGNATFARGDFKKAAALYQQAEELTTDPGLVAFNKATALYNRGQYEEAEKHFWLSLGDAGVQIAARLKESPSQELPSALQFSAGPRLARVLYNLGNCALQRSRGTESDLLEQAVMLFDQCLKQPKVRASLTADVRHNRELARDLLRLHPRPASRQDNSEQPPDNKKPPPRKDNQGSESGDSSPDKEHAGPGEKKKPDPRDKTRSGDDKDADQTRRVAGKGNLAALPDDDRLAHLSPEVATAHLHEEVRRILSDQRRDFQQQATKTSSRNVLDW